MDYKTIWVSDIHLGTRDCKATYLIDFLKSNNCEKLYLVGDIIDGWKLKSGFYWPQEHTNVIRRILTKAKRGTEVIYVLGNHDHFLRQWLEYDMTFGNIRITNEDIHITETGKRFLVTHGDLFDGITRYAVWISKLGDTGYTFLLRVNRYFNKFRNLFGMKYWSLSAFIKHKVKAAVNFITSFETVLAAEVRNRGLDGVICGHIHTPDIKYIDKHILYMNDGDFQESCSALVETKNGDFIIFQYQNCWHPTHVIDSRSGQILKGEHCTQWFEQNRTLI